MNITTLSTGASIDVQLDGKTVRYFDTVESDLDHARMQAEAYADGLRTAFQMVKEQTGTAPSVAVPSEVKPMQLFSWDGEAAGNGTHLATLIAMAPDEDTARELVSDAVSAHIRDGEKISHSQLEEDLRYPPRRYSKGAFVVFP